MGVLSTCCYSSVSSLRVSVRLHRMVFRSIRPRAIETDVGEVRCAEAFGTLADCCPALCPTEQRHRLESAPYNRVGGKAEPVGDERCINRPEVGVMLEVAIVEIIQTRVAAHESGLGDRPHDEDRCGGSVIRPPATRFPRPAGRTH